jgi:hypothetical protein
MIFAHNKAFVLIGAGIRAHCPISSRLTGCILFIAQPGVSPEQ